MRRIAFVPALERCEPRLALDGADSTQVFDGPGPEDPLPDETQVGGLGPLPMRGGGPPRGITSPPDYDGTVQLDRVPITDLRLIPGFPPDPLPDEAPIVIPPPVFADPLAPPTAPTLPPDNDPVNTGGIA